jgi:DNA-binding HxlR family transcriptional regulator
MQQFLQTLGEKWVLPIVSLLFFDQVRFSRLRKELKITSRTLSRKLKELEELGVVQRLCDDAGHTWYCLTGTGKELYTSISRMFN